MTAAHDRWRGPLVGTATQAICKASMPAGRPACIQVRACKFHAVVHVVLMRTTGMAYCG